VIYEFYDKIGRLSEGERFSLLRAFDELVPRIPGRSSGEVDLELYELRHARKEGGRRSPPSGNRDRTRHSLLSEGTFRYLSVKEIR
jgi:hypothetical protein